MECCCVLCLIPIVWAIYPSIATRTVTITWEDGE
jgi:hypothetical protein